MHQTLNMRDSQSPYDATSYLPFPYHTNPYYTTSVSAGKIVAKAVDAAQLINLTEKDGKRNALAAVVTAKREVMSMLLTSC